MQAASALATEGLTPTDAWHTLERIEQAAEVVRARFARTPDVAIILGTGLGGLAERIEVEATIEYGDIPGFPLSTVESHAGRLLCGTLVGTNRRGHAGAVPSLRGLFALAGDVSGASAACARGRDTRGIQRLRRDAPALGTR